jgi:hypothetical protein
MSKNANRLALMLAALGKREAKALALKDRKVALTRLAEIARVRCAVLLGIMLHNKERLGLSDQTMSLILPQKEAAE